MRVQLGVIWSHFGRKEGAVTLLREGLQFNPSSLPLSRVLVEVYHQSGELEEAAEAGPSLSGLSVRILRIPPTTFLSR